jgi:hypothetical protein
MPTLPDTHPSASEVARLLRARTKDSTGKEVGDFTDDTRPNWHEVDDLITTAEGDVLAQTGSLLSELAAKSVRALVALRAAMLVELSYFPEQVRSDRSAYVEYKRLYDDDLAALLRSIEEGGADGGVGGEGYTYHSLPVTPETTYAYYGRAPTGVGVVGAEGPWGDLPGDDWPEAENAANWAQAHQPPHDPPLPEDLPVGQLPSRRAIEIEAPDDV